MPSPQKNGTPPLYTGVIHHSTPTPSKTRDSPMVFNIAVFTEFTYQEMTSVASGLSVPDPGAPAAARPVGGRSMIPRSPDGGLFTGDSDCRACPCACPSVVDFDLRSIEPLEPNEEVVKPGIHILVVTADHALIVEVILLNTKRIGLIHH